jgi:hypothetical protein
MRGHGIAPACVFELLSVIVEVVRHDGGWRRGATLRLAGDHPRFGAEQLQERR